MKVKFNKLIPIFTIAFAVVFWILFYVLEKNNPHVKVDQTVYFLAPMLIVLSAPMLFVNYLVLGDREIVVNSQFGMPVRRYAIKGWGDLEMNGKQIFINKDGKREKVKFKGFLASSSNLKELQQKINNK